MVCGVLDVYQQVKVMLWGSLRSELRHTAVSIVGRKALYISFLHMCVAWDHGRDSEPRHPNNISWPMG